MEFPTYHIIERAIVEDPPASSEIEVREWRDNQNFNADLDKLRSIGDAGVACIF